jgi:hypothetical protein
MFELYDTTAAGKPDICRYIVPLTLILCDELVAGLHKIISLRNDQQQVKQLTTALKVGNLCCLATCYVTLAQDKDFFRSLAVIRCGEPPRHRLVTKTRDDNGSLEEVILFAQGILCEKNLPPLARLPQYVKCS